MPYVLYACAAMIGFDKGGIPGTAAFGISFVLSYGDTARIGQMLGLFVPVLFMSDLGAAISYRKYVDWSVLNPLWLPSFIGLAIGAYCLGSLPEWVIKKIAGFALLLLSLVHFYMKRFKLELPQHVADETSKSSMIMKRRFLKSGFFGILIGFFTLIANIAGPVLVIYLLQIGMLKKQMNGTRALFFVVVNCVKIPLQIYLGNLNVAEQIKMLTPLIIIGMGATILSAEIIVSRIDQNRFERISWILVLVAACKLILIV